MAICWCLSLSTHFLKTKIPQYCFISSVLLFSTIYFYFLPVHHLPLFLCLRKYLSIIQSIYLFIEMSVFLTSTLCISIYLCIYQTTSQSILLTIFHLTRFLLSCHRRFFLSAFTSSSSRRDQNAKSVGSNPKLE